MTLDGTSVATATTAAPAQPDLSRVVRERPSHAPSRAQHRGWLSLDLDPQRTLILYVCLALLVARWTVFSWVNAHALQASSADFLATILAQFMASPKENAVSTVACIYLHILPIFAYQKARRLSVLLEDEVSLSRQIIDKAKALENPNDPSLVGLQFEELEQTYFGTKLIGPSQARLASARIKVDVFRRVSQLRFDPTGALVQPYRDELIGQVPDITKYQRISLQLGILLTFFGLMWVFGSSQFLGSGESGGTSLLNNSLFSALNLAFGSSVAGLLSSICVIMLADSLRTRLLEAFRTHEVMAEALNAVAMRTFRDPRLRDSLHAAERAIDRAGAALDAQLVRTDAVLLKVQEVNDTVASATPQVAHSVRSLHEEIATLNARQAELLSQLQASFSELTPSAIGETLSRGLDASLKELSQAMRSAAETMASVERAVQKVETVHLDSMGALGEMARQIAGVQQEMTRLRPAVESPQSGLGRWMAALLDRFRRS